MKGFKKFHACLVSRKKKTNRVVTFQLVSNVSSTTSLTELTATITATAVFHQIYIHFRIETIRANKRVQASDEKDPLHEKWGAKRGELGNKNIFSFLLFFLQLVNLSLLYVCVDCGYSSWCMLISTDTFSRYLSTTLAPHAENNFFCIYSLLICL